MTATKGFGRTNKVTGVMYQLEIPEQLWLE